MAGLLRTIPFAMEYTITRSGEVRHESNRHKPVPPSVHEGRFGMRHLQVELAGEPYYVWKLLSYVWYDRKIILTRDGGLLRWSHDEVFVLDSVTRGSETAVTDFEEIQYVWFLYQQKKASCWEIAEKSKLLSHSIEDYRNLIKDILIASVR